MAASKKHELCRDKFSQNTKNAYTENYNNFWEKWKKNICRDVPYSRKKDGVVRCHFFQINRLHVVQIKIPVDLFVEIDKLVLKFIWDSKD